MKTLHFISGLPRSGTTLISSIFKQNPAIHSEAVSSLASLVGSIHASWNNYEQNQEYNNEKAKAGLIAGAIQGYYQHVDKNIVIDKDRGWISILPLVESVLQKQIKIIVCVRNPAEILTSFEKLRKDNPIFYPRVDSFLKENTNIASRAYYYSSPEGPLGMAHRNLKDAVTMGYLDRLLFVDYNKYCSTPKAQTKRIYDFLELPYFDHDFQNIQQEETYNDIAIGLPGLHKVKPQINKTTVNCVEYIGLDLYEQYNREIFWNAWI